MYYKQDYKDFLESENMKNYNYIIIDPPWNYLSKPPAVMHNQLTYLLWDNKELENIFKLNVDYIFLWITNSMIPNAFEAAKNSEFIYKTMMTWVKLTPKGNLAFGLGNTFRNCTEQLMIFQKKKAKCLNLSFRTVLLSESQKRTAKPHHFEKELVEKLKEKNLSGVYIFSGGELDFIDSVDIV